MTLQIAGNMHQRRELKMSNIFFMPHSKKMLPQGIAAPVENYFSFSGCRKEIASIEGIGSLLLNRSSTTAGYDRKIIIHKLLQPISSAQMLLVKNVRSKKKVLLAKNRCLPRKRSQKMVITTHLLSSRRSCIQVWETYTKSLHR